MKGDFKVNSNVVNLRSGKIYVVTRVTKDFVWLRWEAYGRERRGLSIKRERFPQIGRPLSELYTELPDNYKGDFSRLDDFEVPL
jgi:hypothetical protein